MAAWLVIFVSLTTGLWLTDACKNELAVVSLCMCLSVPPLSLSATSRFSHDAACIMMQYCLFQVIEVNNMSKVKLKYW